MYSACILHVSCSRSCILAFEGGYIHISVSQLYPDVYPNVFLGYIRIHQDTSGYIVFNVSWTEYRGSHRIRTEYVRIRSGYSILEDTSGYTQDTSGYVRIQI